jgi:hypothetical protein
MLDSPGVDLSIVTYANPTAGTIGTIGDAAKSLFR